MGDRKNSRPITRRRILSVGGAIVLTHAVGCVPGFQLPIVNPLQSRAAFRRSGRGGHVSNAAKMHNANRVYATQAAALSDPAHPGDRSKVVRITLSGQRHAELFNNDNLIADLRWNA